MSSRDASIPRDLADSPSSPFLPVVPTTSFLRSPIARRRPTLPPVSNALRVAPFGEIGREHETDDFDVLSVLSGVSAGEADADPESVPFQPQMRDLRMRRHNIKRRVPAVAMEAQGPYFASVAPAESVAAAAAAASSEGSTKSDPGMARREEEDVKAPAEAAEGIASSEEAGEAKEEWDSVRLASKAELGELVTDSSELSPSTGSADERKTNLEPA
ncbi:hypothetical protein JCM10908_001139 [Rhodotorula pacifica]|uniref:uncharacterized protein n=1 Tax=Rhodotorula pacifica TaxID=1495444 RepID=UPI0031763E21